MKRTQIGLGDDVAIAVSTLAADERRRRATCLAALGAANVADVWTTHQILARGGSEVNPVADWLLEAGALLPAKIALVVLLGVLAARVPVERRWVGTAFSVVAALYVVVVAMNGIQLTFAG